MQLFTTPKSANGRKVLAAVRQLQLDVAVIDVDVYAGQGRDPEYRRIHPLGKVPALQVGEFALWESNAILQFLAEGPGGGRLTLGDPIGRADVARWLFWEATTWQPAITTLLADPVGHLLRPEAVPQPGPVDWSDATFASALELLEHRLGQGGNWICGDQMTVADFSIAGMAMYLGPCGFDFETAPNLARWMARLGELPSWSSTRVDPWTW